MLLQWTGQARRPPSGNVSWVSQPNEDNVMQTWTIYFIETAIYVPILAWMIWSHRTQKRKREARDKEWARLDAER